jgi:hypothetical protein
MQIVDTVERALARNLANPDSEYAKAVMAAQAEASAPPELTADERVQELQRQLATVQDELDAAADAARRGDAKTASGANLPELAARIATLQSELSTARAAAANAELERQSRERQTQEQKFAEAVEGARTHRDEFRTAYQQAIVALGRYCREVEVACQARNGLSRALADPARDAELASITNAAELEVRDELLAKGFGPVLGFGWNFNFQLSPLLAKKENNQ